MVVVARRHLVGKWSACEFVAGQVFACAAGLAELLCEEEQADTLRTKLPALQRQVAEVVASS
jgi:hypothetical protein